ncbi:ABC transporter permease [Halalkalibacterium ligniniphilum]|uniref:ABC transporter permease n=1 Tax=Halalkalibacterium ligniniphilum TaxID=1134413 RepID=UPI000347EEDF|nr:ABC transporter permease [Halalkalibacterium ligniniphilum]
MMNGGTIWRERVSAYWNEAIRYLRLIGNSGFLFTVYVLIILGSYYYSLLLDWLPETFPAIVVFTVVFTWLLSRSPVRTFVKEADSVFLLPYEGKLDRYFFNSRIYSYILQSFILALVLLVLSPLYFQYLGEGGRDFWSVLFALVIMKGINLWMSWAEQRLQTDVEKRQHLSLRIVVNGVFVYLLFVQAGLLYVLAVIVIALLLFVGYFRRIEKNRTLKWEHLIKLEQRMVMFFYRIANTFTDVPQLKNQIKPRSYAAFLLPLLSRNDKSTYGFLYARTFLRANDYFGIYVRLLIISVIMMAILPDGWQPLVFLLFLYMAGLQISTLQNHYETKIWIDLYPVSDQEKKAAFSSLVLRLLLVMTLVNGLTLFLASTLLIGAVAMIAGGIFSYVYCTRLVFRQKKQS